MTEREYSSRQSCREAHGGYINIKHLEKPMLRAKGETHELIEKFE